MKKKIFLLIGLFGCTAIFAQNERQGGDEMVAAENYSGAAMMYRLCKESDEQCLMKLFKLIYEKKIETQSTDELYQLISTPAKNGNAEAQYYFGEMYLSGNGVSKNNREAMSWLRKSAKQGNVDAQNKLSDFSRNKKELHPNSWKNIVSLGAGLGLQRSYFYFGDNYSVSNSQRPLYFNLSFERIVLDNLFDGKGALGVGGTGAYAFGDIGKLNGKSDYHDIIIGIRGALHYSLIEKLDVYVGAMGGCNIYVEKALEEKTQEGSFAYAVFAGARFHVFQSIAVFAEAGYGYTLVNAGLSYCF